jgi:pyruvate/2-oxoglutarate dehydrogenase complex dihydrolipoamide acyltransferase (E2) component
VQSETTLYLAVVENAARMTCAEFIERLTTLQRKALAHQLRWHETSGATITFRQHGAMECHLATFPCFRRTPR